jgi:pimeloyl-ACP methyl ester carboxylesterase
MPRIDIGEISLNYVEQGQGEPILFIPGMMGLLEAWKFQFEHFSPRYRCISFDHRGTGESDKPPDAYSTQLVARDAVALLDRLGIEKAHVAGTSTGGCVLQVLAIDHPNRLLTATFNNTWTTADEYIRRVQTFRQKIAKSYGAESYVEFSSLWTCGPLQFRHDWEELQRLEARQKQTIAPVDVLIGRLQMSIDHNRVSDLHRISTPSLVIGTRDDSTVPAYFSEDLAAAIAGAELVMLEEGGHYSYRHNPKGFNDAFGKFIERNKGSKGSKE